MIFLKQAKTKRNSMGLEQMGQCVFEGAETTLTPAIMNGKVVHGYDLVKDKDAIKIIESHYGRKIDEDIPAWGREVLLVPHTVSAIDPKNGADLLKLGLLKAQGKLAPSIAEQADPNETYQFVLVNEGAEAQVTATSGRRKAVATAKLVEIDAKDPDYMIALCKFIVNYTGGIKTKDQAFTKLTEFIEGKNTGKVGESVDYFLENLDPLYGGNRNKDGVFVRAIVEEAEKANIIRYNRERKVWTNAWLPDNSDYGRDKDSVVQYLLQINNADHLGTGTDKDEPYAIKFQLANRKGQI